MSPRKQRRAKGDGGLFKRADGMWVGSVEIASADGKRRQKRVYGRTYKMALDKLREVRDQVNRGTLPVTSKTTLAQWLAHWLEHIKKPHVRPSTYEFYEEAVRLHIVPKLGTVRLDRLNAQQVRLLLSEVNTSRNAQRVHMTLQLALKAAVNDGLLARNIMDAVEKPGHVKTERGALAAGDAKTVIRTAITMQETSTDETAPLLATRWAAGFLTGARPAELRGLEWDRVDLDNGLFDFSWQLQRHKKVHGCQDADGEPTCKRTRQSYCPQARWDLPDGFEYRECYKTLILTRPKTKTGTRVVPIVPSLLALLRVHHAAVAGHPNPHGLVWHHRDGRPLAPHDERHAWTALIAEAGLPAVEPYAARHSTATLLDELGVGEEVRMQIMGQSSKVAHRMYVHVDQSRTRAALDKLGGMLLEG